MKTQLKAGFLALMLMAAPAMAEPLSTAETDVGTLLDNPVTRAIVDKHLPGFSQDPQVDMARPMTLRGIQQFAPDKVTDDVLKAIDADLAKLDAK